MAMLVQMEFCMDGLGPAWQKGWGEYGAQAAGTLRKCTGGARHSLCPLSLGSKNTHPQGQTSLKA